MSNSEWRVGVLFSRSGVTTVTETEHFLGTALAVEEINAAGGVLGRPIQPIAYDPGGDNSAYRSLARRLLAEDDVNIIFGCSTSASRKAVLPIVERHNGLLFYPSMYEGFEYSENVVYTGATLNQNTFALAEFLLRNYGQRIYFVGVDYIYPRESNRVMRDIVESKGGQVVGERYIPLHAGDDFLQQVLSDITRLKPDAIFSTVIGRPAQQFYRMYAEAGFDRRRTPIASLTMAETEIREIGANLCTGHILSATYFQTVEGEANTRFVEAYKSRFGSDVTTSVWSQPAYTQVHLFARALKRAGSLETHRISEEVLMEDFMAPEGRVSFDSDTRHLWLHPRIGIAREDGLFDIAWQAPGPIRPDPYLTASRFEDAWLEV
ncbi:transporter substrate-binding domain-containing protein [Rhizobium glycinendophyticum]|uniref:Amino acid ABC transporter substrate-binding protein n=1 Tax=Rhizobium glycinendophyticum TaxID=2589807 RepID=A0A504TP92_9HYPH|nr:transporter substrate-binding domain-containing protein [Rhizobium glycinendophyticum]TPP03964.1 amino acid ABC transporter substrate-binding protein [Rhizobium glycinendophyticum]